ALFTCILIILTLTANLFVCVATLRTNSARPLTNYFIINLCIADILIAIISMPVWVLFQIYGLALGRVLGLRFLEFWGSFDILCGTASILSLSCISVDRYMAITRPFTYVRCMTCRRAFLMTCVIWLYAGMYMPCSFIAKYISILLLYMPGSFIAICLYFIAVYAWFVLFASFIIPFIVILAAYTKIFKVAMTHARDITRHTSYSRDEKFHRVSRDLKAAKTISVVIGTFVCCWAPFMVVSVCYAYFMVNMQVGNFTKWLAYLNALLNPLVYSCVDKQLRTI
ncbi:predicted protein, partial [Nematostella vectensis]